MSPIATRRHQMFPVLDAAQIATVRRFASGPERHFAQIRSAIVANAAAAPA
ncbi:hypothetical protein U1839_26230 [Sphingomonas sp. RT2P30]|uniref:hypothetical protein n=1 Tax=Parasphingomonas halimpatiens TaxID=3096162 RepID=UPI002FC97AD6